MANRDGGQEEVQEALAEAKELAETRAAEIRQDSSLLYKADLINAQKSMGYLRHAFVLSFYALYLADSGIFKDYEKDVFYFAQR